MSIEAMKLGLEYAEGALSVFDSCYKRHPSQEPERNEILQDIAAIRQAIEQAEQAAIKRDLTPEQANPVACPYCHNSHTLGAVYFDQNCAGCVKRMTAPPPRQPLDKVDVACDIKTLCANGDLPDAFEDVADWVAAGAIAEQAQPVACIACDQAHAVLDADESKIIRDAKDGYPEGRKPRVLTLAERVSALCTYAADWKRWCLEKEAAPPPRQPWVGLTNQELVELTAIYSGAPLYCAIEAKLKEKNT